MHFNFQFLYLVFLNEVLIFLAEFVIGKVDFFPRKVFVIVNQRSPDIFRINLGLFQMINNFIFMGTTIVLRVETINFRVLINNIALAHYLRVDKRLGDRLLQIASRLFLHLFVSRAFDVEIVQFVVVFDFVKVHWVYVLLQVIRFV